MPLTVMNRAVAERDGNANGLRRPVWRCVLDSTSARYAIGGHDDGGSDAFASHVDAGDGECVLDGAGFHLAPRSLSIWTKE